jgi:hypothetical protein
VDPAVSSIDTVEVTQYLNVIKYLATFPAVTHPEDAMGWYELAKVLHFLGLIALFGFFVLWPRAGGRLRASASRSEARSWLGLLEVARPMLPSGIVMLLASGVAMAALRWRGPYPFATVGLVTATVIWLAWAFVGARHLRAMRAVLGDGDGPVTGQAADVIRDPAPWGVTGALNGAALGVLFVMTTKLGWIAASGIVLALAALVGLAFTRGVRRQRDALAAGREAGA